MAAPLSSQQDFYNLFITTLQNKLATLTDTLDGSIIDGLAGTYSVAAMELQRQTSLAFNKTFIDLANGPDITGGPDDLAALAVDHYGAAFARPGAIAASDVATFSRPNNQAGQITILSGTTVQTKPDANGNIQQYTTQAQVVLTATGAASDLTVSVPIVCTVGGVIGNASAGAINTLQTPLLDSTIVVTNAGNTSGVDAQSDAVYRETIRNLIVALRAAVRSAIQAAALAVPGIVSATAVEVEIPVVNWNIATNSPSAPQIAGIYQYFYIPYVTLYIANSGGSATPTQVAAVQAAINQIRAFGVSINVSTATVQSINWSAHLTLNPSGPNYANLQSNTAPITAAMASYISTLGTGVSFSIATANAAMLALFGPGGTNDLTGFTTVIPTGDVAIGTTTNAIPGTMATV